MRTMMKRLLCCMLCALLLLGIAPTVLAEGTEGDPSENPTQTTTEVVNKNPYNVFLCTYLNGAVDKTFDITEGIAADGTVTLDEAVAKVDGSYTVQDGKSLEYDGLYLAESSSVTGFDGLQKYERFADVNTLRQTQTVYLILGVNIKSAEEQFKAEVEASNGDYQLGFDMLITQDLELNLNSGLCVNGGTLTVAPGATLTINTNGDSHVTLENGGTLNVNGALNLNTGLFILNGSQMNVSGTMTNRGNVHVGYVGNGGLSISGTMDNYGYVNVCAPGSGEATSGTGTVTVTGAMHNKKDTDGFHGFVELHGIMNVNSGTLSTDCEPGNGGIQVKSTGKLAVAAGVNTSGVQDGSVVAEAGATVTGISAHLLCYVTDEAALLSALADAGNYGSAEVLVNGQVTLNTAATVGENITLVVLSGKQLVLMKDLTVDGTLIVEGNESGNTALEINGGSTLFINGSFQNMGNTHVGLYETGTLEIKGTMDNTDYLNICVPTDQSGEGTVRVSGVLNNDGYLDHHGKLHVSGSLKDSALHTIFGELHVTGDWKIQSSDVVIEQGSAVLVENTTVNVPYETTLLVKGDLHLKNSTANIGGTLDVDGSLWINNGSTVNVDGALDNSGSVHVGFEGNGTLNVNNNMLTTGYVNITPTGIVNVKTLLEIKTAVSKFGFVQVDGKLNLTDSGVIDVYTGNTNDGGGILVNATGVMTVAEGAHVTLISDAMLGVQEKGSLDLKGSVYVNKNSLVGIAGTLTQSGNLHVGLDGAGQMDLDGTANLTGYINVTPTGRLDVSGTLNILEDAADGMNGFLQDDGIVVFASGAKLTTAAATEINGGVSVNAGATFTATGADLTKVTSGTIAAVVNKVTISGVGNKLISATYAVESEDDLNKAASEFAPSDYAYASVDTFGDFAITGEAAIGEDVVLNVGHALTVSGTLTVNGGLNVTKGTVTVSGTLNNNGLVSLNYIANPDSTPICGVLNLAGTYTPGEDSEIHCYAADWKTNLTVVDDSIWDAESKTDAYSTYWLVSVNQVKVKLDDLVAEGSTATVEEKIEVLEEVAKTTADLGQAMTEDLALTQKIAAVEQTVIADTRNNITLDVAKNTTGMEAQTASYISQSTVTITNVLNNLSETQKQTQDAGIVLAVAEPHNAAIDVAEQGCENAGEDVHRFSMTLSVDETPVTGALQEPVAISIDKPANFDANTTVLLHVLDSGAMEKVDYVENGTKLVFTLNSFSDFIFTKLHVCSPKSVDATAASATAHGMDAHYACDCGKRYEDAGGKTPLDEEKAKRHPAGADYESDAADHWFTCMITEDGSACGEILEKAAHTLEAVEAKEAAAEAHGNVAHSKCSICAALVLDGKKVTEEETWVHFWGNWEDDGTNHKRACQIENCDAAEEHESKYKTAWSTDDKQHFHACETEGCTLVKDAADHDGKQWGASATKHWKVCSVCGAKGAEENHGSLFHRKPYAPDLAFHGQIEHYECQCGSLFADAAGTKQLTADQIVVHLEDQSWTTDASSHWKVCVIKEDGVACDYVVTKAVHIDNNNNKECDICDRALPVNQVPAGSGGSYSSGGSSYSGSGSTSARISISGETGTVPVSLTISGKTASVGTMTKAQVEKAMNAEDTLHLDMTGLNRKITGAEVPRTTMQYLVNAGSTAALEVKLTAGTMHLDQKALKTVLEENPGGAVRLVLEEVGISTLNNAQQNALADQEVHGIYNATLLRTVNNRQITDFGGGTVTLCVDSPVISGRSAEGFLVSHLDLNGILSEMESESGLDYTTWWTDHFSTFVITYQESAEEAPEETVAETTVPETTAATEPTETPVVEAEPESKGMGITGYLVILLLSLLALAALGILYIRKRK